MNLPKDAIENHSLNRRAPAKIYNNPNRVTEWPKRPKEEEDPPSYKKATSAEKSSSVKLDFSGGTSTSGKHNGQPARLGSDDKITDPRR